MWINLFYDKYAGDINGKGNHHYNNEMTSKVSIEDLNDGSYTLYYDKAALEYYNKKFPEHFSLPECLYKSELFKLIVYTKNIKSFETIYVLVSINSGMLENKIRKGLAIDHIDFLKQLFRYHMAYTQPNKFITNNNFCWFNSEEQEKRIKQHTDYIIENAMKPVDYTFDNKIDNPSEINLNLFDYQKCSIHWAIQKEKNKKKIHYNLNDEIIIGNIYYDINTQKLDLTENRKSITFNGGCIIDEVGLGKTLQIIGLSLKNTPESISYVQPNLDKFFSKATLVFCPNQLCGQWIRELKNRLKNKDDFNIVQLMTKRDHDKFTYNDLLDADFVIVSYTFLDNKSFTLPWTSKISTYKNFHKQEWKNSDVESITKLFNEMSKELISDPINSLYKNNPQIQLIHWNRFVVDEFHEIYKDTTYRYISNLLPFISANYKWCVTATPFNQSKCLFKIVDFLSNYKITDGDRICQVEEIIDYLSYNCFRRNTKANVKKEHSLPPIKEEIRWLKFTSTERMIYNAYLANPNNNKFSVYLRQLCCHPQLAEETKYALSNCKTLEDIEKMMVNHYKLEVDDAQEKVDKIQTRIDKINKKIKKLEKKQKKKQLKKLGKLMEDSDSDDSDDSDDDQDDILMELLMGNSEDDQEIEIKSTATIDNLKEILKQQEIKLKDHTVILDGKKSTYEFFNNVVNRIRKTATKQTDLEKKHNVTSDTNIMDMFSNQYEEDDEEDNDDETCGICLDEIPENDIGVTKCGHIFCYECLKAWIIKSHVCPYCKKKLDDNQVYILSYEKNKDKDKSDKQKDKDQLTNELGTKLANIITYLRDSGEHTIIFSQWDDLLRRVGRILKDNNIPNVFCKGNCYQRDKAIREFNEDEKIRVIMLSSDSTAAGTNLTKASQVIFIDPIYGDYKFRKDQEKQAIGRAHRLGQKSQIKVIRFIIQDTVEDEIYKMNSIEDKKYQSEFESSSELF